MQDENQEDLRPMEEILEVSPTLRGRIFEIFLLVVMSLVFLKVYKMIPPNGMYLNELLGVDWSFLHKKIDAIYLKTPIRILCIGSFLLGLYIYLQQKLTVYRLTHLFLEKKSGVFFRTTNSTDLVSIKDQTLTRNPLEMILGLSTLKIVASDISDPEMYVKAITNSDATKIQNFLQKYAFRTYTEYRISQDKQSRARRKRNEDIVDDDME